MIQATPMLDAAETHLPSRALRRRPRSSDGPGPTPARGAVSGLPEVAGHLLVAAIVVLLLALGDQPLSRSPAAIGGGILAWELLSAAFVLRWSARASWPLALRGLGDALVLALLAHVSGGILSPAMLVLPLIPVGLALLRVSPALVAAISAVAVAGATTVWAAGGAAPGGDPLGRLALVAATTACAGLAGALVAEEYRRRMDQIGALSRALDELMTEVLASEVRQRHDVATRLHDDLMQILLAVRQDIGEAPENATWRLATDHLDTGLERLRASVETLGGRDPRDQPFDDAVRDTAEQQVDGEQALVVAQVSGPIDPLLRPVLLTIVRDLARHAGRERDARHVAIRVAATDDAVTIRVFDDGAEQDGPAEALARCRRWVAAIGATLEVEDQPDDGRRVSVRLPRGRWPR